MSKVRSIETRVRAAYGLAVAFFLVIGLSGWWSAQQYVDTLRWVDHTNRVIRELDNVLQATLDVESSARGFALSGDPGHLGLFDDGRSRLITSLGLVRDLVRDNPDQVERAAELHALVNQRVDHSTDVVKAAEANRAGAQRAVASGEGRDLMDQVRSRIKEMQDEEALLLTARTEANSLRAQFTALLALISGMATLLVIVVSGYLLVRDVRRRLAVEEALRQSEEGLAIMLNSIGDGVLATDGRGLITHMNPIAENLTGWSSEEAKGLPIAEVFNIINEHTRAPAVIPVDDVISTGEIHGLANHTVLISKTGRETAIADSAAPIRDRSGSIVGVVLVFRDVSEERSIADLQAHLAAIVSSTSDAVVSRDMEHRVTTWNAAAERMFGYTAAEALGEFTPNFVPDEELEHAIRVVEKVLSGEPGSNYETVRFAKDGTPVEVSVAITALRNAVGEIVGSTTSYRDISEYKKVLASLNEAKAEAERANAAKSDFLSNMSHELRTPLNAVIGFAQLLDMRSTHPETREASQSILRAGRHLLTLINEILDLARIEAGKLTLSVEAVPVGEILSHSFDLVRPIAEAKGVTVTIDPNACQGMHVMADRQRLVQVLLNLLTNATKYNRPGGKVLVRCASEGQTHRIEVSDDGLGISEQGQARLFQPFERGNHMEEGTGLGLALSQRLMKLMNGDLRLVSTSPSGSTFAIDLQPAEEPAVPAQSSTEPQKVALQGPPERLRIVYVEDNLSNMQLLEQVFETIGNIELIPAMTAGLGLQMVENHLPDLVLLDLHLPDAEGVDVLLKIRTNPKTADIPVVVLSADATEGQINRLLRTGAKSYLTKPVDLQELFAELNDVKKNKEGRAKKDEPASE